MEDPKNYSVAFNRDAAFTIVYGDSEGGFLFVFEVGDTEKDLILHRNPVENDAVVKAVDDETIARVNIALSRTKEFLLSRGFNVELF